MIPRCVPGFGLHGGELSPSAPGCPLSLTFQFPLGTGPAQDGNVAMQMGDSGQAGCAVRGCPLRPPSHFRRTALVPRGLARPSESTGRPVKISDEQQLTFQWKSQQFHGTNLFSRSFAVDIKVRLAECVLCFTWWPFSGFTGKVSITKEGWKVFSGPLGESLGTCWMRQVLQLGQQHTHTCPRPAMALHMCAECLPSSSCMLPQGTPFGRPSREGQPGGAVLQLPSCACFLTLHAR